MIKLTDIAWAAGFLEGDGHFGTHRDGKRTLPTGTITIKHGGPVITADQVNIEPLDRLLDLFGGWMGGPYATKAQSRYRWECGSFSRCAGMMMTLWPFMSRQKRAQIEKALAHWKVAPKPGGYRGHKKQEKRDD